MPQDVTPIVIPKVESTPSQAISDKEIEMIGTVIASFAQPMAKAQETVAIETTKQTKIIADATQKTYRGFFLIGFGILVLAGIAMWRDKEQMTQTLVVALLSFLGGLGIGKSLNK